jgi:hypothetical protein
MNRLSLITAFLLYLFLWQCVSFIEWQNHEKFSFPWEYGATNCAYAQGESEQPPPNIEWFKKELRISPKYQEREIGIMGLSWAHFLVMVFLTVSFVIALIALIVRYTRTKELVAMLTKEEKIDGKKS